MGSKENLERSGLPTESAEQLLDRVDDESWNRAFQVVKDAAALDSWSTRGVVETLRRELPLWDEAPEAFAQGLYDYVTEWLGVRGMNEVATSLRSADRVEEVYSWKRPISLLKAAAAGRKFYKLSEPDRELIWRCEDIVHHQANAFQKGQTREW